MSETENVQDKELDALLDVDLGGPHTPGTYDRLTDAALAALADRLEQAERDRAAVERVILVREQLRKRFRDCPEDHVLLIAAICNDLADALRTTEADR